MPQKSTPATCPPFDLLCGGFPCQSWSAAGHRLAFADPRGALFFEIARLAEARKPAYLLLENVLRLQGFDEDQIDRLLAITSDAQAYKQTGNTVPVNVVEAIGRRIRAVDEALKKEDAA